VEFRSSPEFRRLLAARPRSPSAPREQCERSRGRDPPLLGFLLLEHHDLGRPVRRETRFLHVSRGGRGLPTPSRCRPQGWFPLDGSGCSANRSDPVRSPPIFRVAPKLRGPVSCRSRSLESPFRAFPSRGAVPALAGRCFLAGSRSTTASAARASPSHRFRLRADPLPRFAARLTGRLGHDGGFPRC